MEKTNDKRRGRGWGLLSSPAFVWDRGPSAHLYTPLSPSLISFLSYIFFFTLLFSLFHFTLFFLLVFLTNQPILLFHFTVSHPFLLAVQFSLFLLLFFSFFMLSFLLLLFFTYLWVIFLSSLLLSLHLLFTPPSSPFISLLHSQHVPSPLFLLNSSFNCYFV